MLRSCGLRGIEQIDVHLIGSRALQLNRSRDDGRQAGIDYDHDFLSSVAIEARKDQQTVQLGLCALPDNDSSSQWTAAAANVNQFADGAIEIVRARKKRIRLPVACRLSGPIVANVVESVNFWDSRTKSPRTFLSSAKAPPHKIANNSPSRNMSCR